MSGVARKDERRIEIAHFPTVRDLDGFDFAAQPSLDRTQSRELAACRWVAQGAALLLPGPLGGRSIFPAGVPGWYVNSLICKRGARSSADRATAF